MKIINYILEFLLVLAIFAVVALVIVILYYEAFTRENENSTIVIGGFVTLLILSYFLMSRFNTILKENSQIKKNEQEIKYVKNLSVDLEKLRKEVDTSHKSFAQLDREIKEITKSYKEFKTETDKSQKGST